MPVPSLKADATPEAWAEAMLACQGWAPACSDANECFHDGACFGKSGRGFKRARQDLQKLIDAEGDVHTRAWLKLGLDALEQHQFIVRGALDAMRIVTINKAVRKQYNAEGRK